MGGKYQQPRSAVIGEHITDVPIKAKGDTTRKARLIEKARATGYNFGTLQQCRDAFTVATKLPAEWEVETDEPD